VSKRIVARVAVTAMVFAAFTVGYVCGSVGSIGQLGSSIVEMEQHVSGLQKNLDVLKKVQSALTGK
jgi:hypothetical protein